MYKTVYRHRPLLQILAYVLVVAAAAFANYKVVDVNRNITHSLRQSQYHGCIVNNQRVRQENVKFVALYNIVTDAIRHPDPTRPPLTAAQLKKLRALQKRFQPLQPTNCAKAYPELGR